MPLFFPKQRGEWRLDVVSLLAVIGESSMSKHAQPLTASWLCLLPRLIPAPQALMRPSRPSGLAFEHAHVVGVHSGNYLQELNYFANLIHPISDLKRHSVWQVNIKHKTIDKYKDKAEKLPNVDRVKEIVPKPFSVLNCLTVASTLLTLGLLIWAGIVRDGGAFCAILIISTTSSMVGLASFWHPLLTERVSDCEVPPGDVVIRTRTGAFVVVDCTEEVARELYVGAEDCKYVLHTRPAQILVGAGTVLLMFGVILIGNSTFELQLALGATYIALNGFYWAAALLPARGNWDLHTRYDWSTQQVSTYDSYTLTLYHTIIAASPVRKGENHHIKTDWVRTSGAAPDTVVWNKWLAEVADKGNTKVGDDEWSPVQCWRDIKKADDAEKGIVKQARRSSTSPGPVMRRPTDDLNGPKTFAD